MSRDQKISLAMMAAGCVLFATGLALLNGMPALRAFVVVALLLAGAWTFVAGFLAEFA